jgi:hypothetical protein
VRIDHDVALLTAEGERLPPSAAGNLPEGSVIVVDGKRSKRGVLRPTQVLMLG